MQLWELNKSCKSDWQRPSSIGIGLCSAPASCAGPCGSQITSSLVDSSVIVDFSSLNSHVITNGKKTLNEIFSSDFVKYKAYHALEISLVPPTPSNAGLKCILGTVSHFDGFRIMPQPQRAGGAFWLLKSIQQTMNQHTKSSKQINMNIYQLNQ